MKRLLSIAALMLALLSTAKAQAPHVDVTIEDVQSDRISASFDFNETCQKAVVLIADMTGEEMTDLFGMTLANVMTLVGNPIYTDTMLTWVNIDPATDYHIFVMAMGGGDTTYAVTDIRSLDGNNAIAEVNSSALCCYPNPATDHINIDLSGISDARWVELVDMSGRIVMRQMAETGMMTIQFNKQIVPGVYLLRIVGEGMFPKCTPIIKR